MKLLILSRIQKKVLTNLKLQLLITSLKLNLPVENSSYNFSKLDKGNFTLLNYLLKIKNGQYSDLLKSLFRVYLIEMIYELRFS